MAMKMPKEDPKDKGDSKRDVEMDYGAGGGLGRLQKAGMLGALKGGKKGK